MSWTDDELARAMADIDPARTPIDSPPDAGDRARLSRIMADRPRRAGRRAPAARLAWALPAAAAVVVAATVAVSALSGAPAYARTPPPLTVTPLNVSAEEFLTDSERILADAPTATAVRDGQVVRWRLREDGSNDPVMVPEWQEWVWNDDGTGYLRATAGAPYSVTSDGRIVDPVDDAPTEGTSMGQPRWGPNGLARGYFPEPPPADPQALAGYLRTHAFLPDDADALAYWGAISLLLDEWSLNPAQHAAALRLLEDSDGLSVLGTVTDRLGRDGVVLALASRSRPEFSAHVVIDAESRRIIAADIVYLGGLERLDVPKGSVIEYSAWLER